MPLNWDISTDSLDAVDVWFHHLRASGRSEQTLTIYRYAVEQLRAWRTSDPDLTTLTRLEARAFVRHLLDRYQPNGVRSRVKSLRACWSFLVAEELATENVFARIQVTVPEEAQPILSDEELDRILAHAKPNRRDYALIVMLADTGARKGEVAAVRWEDVDLPSGVVRFPVSKTRVRTVPMSDRLASALVRWVKVRGVGPGSLWKVSDTYGLVKVAVTKHSGGTASPHKFRRRFAVEWLRKGGSEIGLQRVAGWNSNTMIKTYVAAKADELATDEMRRLMG